MPVRAWSTGNVLVGVCSGLALAGGELRHPIDDLVDEVVGALVRGARGP
jgi:hypothetical protein